MKLLIIGGGAGGPASASRMRRMDENAEIIMFERGEHISYGHCGLPYYIGGVISNRPDLLLSNPEKFKQLYNVEVRIRSLVYNISTDNKQIEVMDLNTGKEYQENYDKIILSTGADPIKPPLPGIDLNGIFTLRNLTDADNISQFIKERKPKKVAIIGGGFIGLEMAENFERLGMSVTIVEMLDQVMAPFDREMAQPLERTLALHGIELVLSDPVAGFENRDGYLVVKVKSGKEITCDMVMLSIGVKPNLDLAKSANIETDRGIKVNEYMQSSNPDIYAVGDGVETKHLVTGESVLVPLAGPSARQARIAASNICGRSEKYKGTLGTGIVKVFETTIGSTGANEKTLKRLGISYQKCYAHPFSHVNYYPDSAQMIIKLTFSPENGRLLGAQIVGTDGVDKRVDTLATAISAGMTVNDLTELELGYVPQYGSAKEAVNVAGYVASNVLNGDMSIEHWDNIENLADGTFLDVRESDVTAVGMIPNAINIPLTELRNRLDELPKDKPIYTYCNVGLESYIATRMLRHLGYDAINISGGYSMLKNIKGETPVSINIPPKPAEEPKTAEVKNSEIELLDACGLQCPGPILKVKQKMDQLQPGDILEISANDTGFAIDLPAWCRTTGNEVLSIEVREGKIIGRIRKKGADETIVQQPSASIALPKEKTIVVFSNDMDRVMSAFIIANGSASMGYKVNLFFTFWGLNVLRKSQKVSVSKSFIERMFGWMMPRGVSKLTLSKLNMGGMGTLMMKNVMKQKNVQPLEELIQMAKQQGVRLVACTMTMSIMGLQKEELIDGIEEGGVAAFIEDADHSNVTLFI